VDGRASIHRKRRPGFLVGYANSGLPFHHRQIPLNGLHKAGLVKHNGMERLRKTPYFLQRGLGDLANLKQIGTQLRSFLDLIASPPQHCAHCREDLTEVVVQLTRDMPQSGFLGGDQFLC